MSEAAFLFSGVVFGLAAGMSPGPLLTLVVSETVRHGVREGAKVAVAPLLTDLPIVLVSLLILSRVKGAESILGVISLLGGAFVGYLGYESVRAKAADLDLQEVQTRSLRKGVVTNFLNPHPYMFWLAVGGPTLFKAAGESAAAGVLFLAGFYVLIIGSKMAVALAVGRFRLFLKSRVYIYTIRFLGVVLLIFAALFIKDGLVLLGLTRK